MENFVEEYLRLSARAESPTSYLKWGAYSCLSAVLRDNVWFAFPERLTRLYPNLYILILGDTSVVRKSAPFDINERLLRGSAAYPGVNNTKVMAGSATMQGVLKTLSQTDTANGNIQGGSGYMCAKEAAGFFIQDPQTIGILTDLYDYHALYDKHLASYDFPPIKNVCLSMFAGTNETMIQKMLDQTAKEGGFLGRCFVIHETKRRQKDSGFEEDRTYVKEEEWKEPITFLKKLATMKGPISFELAARRRYNAWYHAFEMEKFHTKTGYEGRLGSHVLKMSLILSAAKPDFNFIIHVDELDAAIEECESLLIVYKRLTYGVGIAPTSSYTIKVTDLLMDAKDNHLSRQQLMYNLHGNITGTDLDTVMKDLVDAGFVLEKAIYGSAGYKLTDKFLNGFREIAEQKTKEKEHKSKKTNGN